MPGNATAAAIARIRIADIQNLCVMRVSPSFDVSGVACASPSNGVAECAKKRDQSRWAWDSRDTPVTKSSSPAHPNGAPHAGPRKGEDRRGRTCGGDVYPQKKGERKKNPPSAAQRGPAENRPHQSSNGAAPLCA